MSEMAKALKDHLKNIKIKHKNRNKHEEADEQMAFVNYVRNKYPNLPMWVSPIFKFGGTKLQRIIQGMKMKRMGYTVGTPDITFLESKKCYSGLVFEFKKPGEKPGEEQIAILDYCKKQGKSVHVVFSSNEAIKIIDWYMFELI